jgi:tetratricopeptide (TPR) repeat protein
MQTVSCKFFPDVLFNWPPPGTVHEVKADNTPLCAVIENMRKKMSPVITASDSIVLLNTKLPRNLTHDEYINLSLDLYEQKRYVECVEACLLALSKNSSSAVAYNNMCSAYNSMQKWQDAERACSMALSLQPDFTLAKSNLEFARKNLTR